MSISLNRILSIGLNNDSEVSCSPGGIGRLAVCLYTNVGLTSPFTLSGSYTTLNNCHCDTCFYSIFVKYQYWESLWITKPYYKSVCVCVFTVPVYFIKKPPSLFVDILNTYSQSSKSKFDVIIGNSFPLTELMAQVVS